LDQFNPLPARAGHWNPCETPPKDDLPVIDIRDVGPPCFGVIFVGFAGAKAECCREAGRAWIVPTSVTAQPAHYMHAIPFTETC
jgi:hypothetical protein